MPLSKEFSNMGLSDTPGIWEVTENYVFASRPSTHTKSKPGSELWGAALEQWIQVWGILVEVGIWGRGWCIPATVGLQGCVGLELRAGEWGKTTGWGSCPEQWASGMLDHSASLSICEKNNRSVSSVFLVFMFLFFIFLNIIEIRHMYTGKGTNG